MQRQGHLVLDQFEGETRSDPKCVLPPDQLEADLSTDQYKQCLVKLKQAIPFAINNAPEGFEAFTTALVEVLFFRQIMRLKSTDHAFMFAIEDVELYEVCDQFEILYKRMSSPNITRSDITQETPLQHVKNESVHTQIVGELTKIFSGLLSKTICLHGARFRELKEELERSLSVKEAYQIIYDAKHGTYQAKNKLEDEPPAESTGQTWFWGFFARESGVQNKSKLSTKPNQTLFGGFFRNFVYDNLEDVYSECMNVFAKYKDDEEVKTVLAQFSCESAAKFNQ